MSSLLTGGTRARYSLFHPLSKASLAAVVVLAAVLLLTWSPPSTATFVGNVSVAYATARAASDAEASALAAALGTNTSYVSMQGVFPAAGTATLNGVEVRTYEHASSTRVPGAQPGSQSDPWDPELSGITLCDGSSSGGAQGCPAQCAAPRTERVAKRRVRKAIGQMSDAEWGKVVRAMWLMRNLTEAEGQARYGPTYRGIDYHVVRHVCSSDSAGGSDVTGGGAQTLPWHALFAMELETSLLLVDPTLPGLPYIDWGRDQQLTLERLGEATMPTPYAYAKKTALSAVEPGSLFVCPRPTSPGRNAFGLTNDFCEMAILADGDFAYWPVGRFDMDAWFAQQSPAVQQLFGEYNASGLAQRATSTTPGGQFRSVGKGAVNVALHGAPVSAYSQLNETFSPSDAGIPYVWRFVDGWRSVVLQHAEQWNLMLSNCGGLGGTFMDASECIDGRVPRSPDLYCHPDFLLTSGGGGGAGDGEEEHEEEETLEGCQFWSLHFPAHLIGGDMEAALAPHDPFFFFHHNSMDMARRVWQAKNERLRPSAFGYPVTQGAFTESSGYGVGLYDCLGCTQFSAGFSRELLLGTADPELNALPLTSGWLTPADVICVLDDIYTYDVLLEAEAAAQEGKEHGLTLIASFFFASVTSVSVGLQVRACLRRREVRSRYGLKMVGDEPATGGYDMRANPASLAATTVCQSDFSK